jgi:6-phosphogluconolactonase (cycloisomerase 2 family)
MKTTATQYLSRTVFLLSLALLQSCGGSGGGGASSPPGILFYTLAENSSGHGYIVENAISPSGQLYSPSPAPISTGGASTSSQDSGPVAFVLDPSASLAFALNSNSSSPSFNKGSIESYNTSSAQSSTGIQSINYALTGINPTSMAVDPGGNYLVVADHGNGTTSGQTGDVEIFPIGSKGATNSTTISTISTNCPNPDKIVFPPSGSTGSSSDIFYVVCSSPELIETSPSPPTPALYMCSITGNCSQVTLPSLSGTSNAISNMEFASNGTAFLPGETYTSSSSSYNAFLITCTGTPLSSCSLISNISSLSDTAPAGDFAVYNGSTPTAFIGNYSTNSNGSLSNQGIFFSCTSGSTSCSKIPYDSSSGDPTFLATNPGQTSLYIVSTPDKLPATTGSIQSTPDGAVYVCSLSSGSSCTLTGTTTNYPVGITFDPSGKFAFVPTWSGTISIFQVGSNGQLTPATSSIVTTGNINLQVVVP